MPRLLSWLAIASCGALACGSDDTDGEVTSTAATSTTSGATGASSAATGAFIGPQPASPVMLGGGFAAINWALPPSTTYEDISIEVRPEITADADDATGQYFGLVLPKIIDSPPGAGLGSVGLRTRLTVSGQRGVSVTLYDGVDVVPHGAVEIDTERCKEGMDVTCTELALPYAWSNDGAYRLRVHFAGPAPTAGDVLLRTSVTDVASGAETILADATVPTAWGKLAVLSQSFSRMTVPLEGDEGKLCTTFAASDVTFSRLRAEPGGAQPTSWMQVLAEYTGPCVDFFHYAPTADGYRLRLGVYAPP